jgi:hypothetical protein
MKVLEDCIKQTICSAFYHLQWLAALAFFVTHHPSNAPCDMLRALVCKPNFACGETSDHSVAEQRFLCHMLSSGFFTSVCSLNANILEQTVCSEMLEFKL